ncbi:MAG: hypothetical protein P4M11_08260 [Candidatus Pacebacteria bacterium]|nr:hypothetical protein [Candidatus Paceibacterota bacterium]
MSIYKVFKHQVVCLHKLLFYLTLIKGIIDLSMWVQEITCSPFYDPSLLFLVKKSMLSIFHSFMAAVVLGISMVTCSSHVCRACQSTWSPSGGRSS